jgi:hypothetical protein
MTGKVSARRKLTLECGEFQRRIKGSLLKGEFKLRPK